jgi:hypothetical protein
VGLAELRFEMKQFNRSIDLLGRALKVYEKVKWKVEIA